MPPTLSSQNVVCFIVRHGRTQLNSERRFRGRSNPPLDEVGEKQAKDLAELFEPINISHVFCSEKQRSIKTAETIAAAKGIPIHSSESLNALDVGDFSGQKRTKENQEALEGYLKGPNTRIPGGETLYEFQSRIRPCLQQAIEMCFVCGAPPLIVAHSSVVREVGTLIRGDQKALLVEPGGILAVSFKDGKLDAKPVYRPLKSSPSSHVETIT